MFFHPSVIVIKKSNHKKYVKRNFILLRQEQNIFLSTSQFVRLIWKDMYCTDITNDVQCGDKKTNNKMTTDGLEFNSPRFIFSRMQRYCEAGTISGDYNIRSYTWRSLHMKILVFKLLLT